MELPRLKVLQGGAGRDLSTCSGKDYCSTCVFHHSKGGRCEGCTAAHKERLSEDFRFCYTECTSCAGYKVKVPAICCRSPMKQSYLDAVTKNAPDWNQPSYDYMLREPIKLAKQRAVFYITSGGTNTIGDANTPLVEGHELIATNLSRVWSGNGFHHKRDLKRYLNLSTASKPTSAKLLLLTMTKDDLLEHAFRRYFYAEPEEYQRVGIDYWMPLSFSAYPAEAHMHQLYQFYRTLYCTEKAQAWFTTGDHFQTGLRLDDLFVKCVERVPNVVFNTQFVLPETYVQHLRWIKHAHEISPKRATFWFVGRVDPKWLHNVKRVCGNGARDLYWVSAKPLYLASKGQRLSMNGKGRPSTKPKLDLVRDNYTTFEQMVNDYGR